MKVCKPCFQGLHCKRNARPKDCECPCGEIEEPRVATPAEWMEIEARQAEIRARMRSVEGRWQEKGVA